MEMAEFSVTEDTERIRQKSLVSERVTLLKVQRQSLQNIIHARTSRFTSKRKRRKP